jgi:hypothetical protein
LTGCDGERSLSLVILKIWVDVGSNQEELCGFEAVRLHGQGLVNGFTVKERFQSLVLEVLELTDSCFDPVLFSVKLRFRAEQTVEFTR